MVGMKTECMFENREFSCLTDMIETLLHEANRQIVQIDVGQKKNTATERAYAKWRLLHLQKCFGEYIPEEYRSTYNSLWSHVYRLEHQVGYRHPYIIYLLEKIFCQNSSHVG